MRLLAILATLVVPTSLYAQGCLSYRERVTVSGLLTQKAFPGPPNFESIAKGDKRDVSYVLVPTHGLCVTALSKDPDEIDVAVQHIRGLQLVLDAKGSRLLKPLLGKKVAISGSLFGAISGWHHTPVLLSDVKLVQPQR